MNRNVTNVIRFIMDEMIPPLLRDSYLFMWPFYCIAYGMQDLKRIMNFKSIVYELSDKEYGEFYSNLKSISRYRATDLNTGSIKKIISQIDLNTEKLLDVGCSSGFLLKKINEKIKEVDLFGTDIIYSKENIGYKYIQSNIHSLPFKNKSFDIVTCNHTLEHIIDIKQSINELCRITKHKLIITIPCQRYYYYTLDEHINFFPHKDMIFSSLGIDKKYLLSCDKIQGDWVIVFNFMGSRK